MEAHTSMVELILAAPSVAAVRDYAAGWAAGAWYLRPLSPAEEYASAAVMSAARARIYELRQLEADKRDVR